MRRAYMDAHHTIIDDYEIIVDYNRQQLMPGWIPRRLGGGLSCKKESGQLRFGGREKPFRAPLKPIPYGELKKLGIPPPPEGRYMSRFQVPSPPRRERNLSDREEDVDRRGSADRSRTEGALKNPRDMEDRHYKRSSSHGEDHSRGRSSSERSSSHREDHSHGRSSSERSARYHDRSSAEKEHRHRSSTESDKHSRKRKERDEHSRRREKSRHYSSDED